jgi:YidC/Oxa1 family membrane protein insertase
VNRLHPHGDPDDIKNLTLLMFLMGFGLIVYYMVFQEPQLREQQKLAMQKQQAAQEEQMRLQEKIAAQEQSAVSAVKNALQSQKAVKIQSPLLTGSISLIGGRFDYLVLDDYRQQPAPDSPPVTLLQPAGTLSSYFVEFGWLSSDDRIELPTSQTLWRADHTSLTEDQPVTLSWQSSQGLEFSTTISIRDDYLFDVEQKVTNRSGEPVELLPYGFINRTFEGEASDLFILHEGPIGVFDETLTEFTYHELDEEKQQSFPNAKGWLGISDKYWLTAIIPQNQYSFTGNFKAYRGKQNLHRYQVDYLGLAQSIPAGESASFASRLFAGAKKLNLLDRFSTEYTIPLFDRAVDLGWLYFLTKPLSLLLNWLYQWVGDFGVAILMVTVLVKAALYPLANKSYIAMNEMKRLQPEMTKLKERYGDDKMAFNQELMKIYKKEKINPASGCLPILIQIPVFFAIYKVLFVTIEMRHANFYHLVHDLSAMDPSNIFTLFGLLEWSPPSFLHLGILPILMAISMWGQQKLNPKPADPIQAKVMGWLPWIVMVILSGFPAGLLIYWIWSNILSILQQLLIKYRYQKRTDKRKAANEA